MADTLETRRRAAEQQDDLGEMMLDIGEAADAKDHCTQAVALWRQIAQETGAAADRRDLAGSCGMLGDAHRAMGDLAAAEQCYSQSLAISQSLAEVDPTLENRYEVAAISQKLGDVAARMGNLFTAKVNYERDLQLSQAFVQEDPHNDDRRRELLHSQLKLGEVLLAVGDRPGARQLFAAAYDRALALYAGQATGDNRCNLAVCALRMGTIVSSLAEHDAAQGYLDQGRALWQAEYDRQPAPLARGWLAFALRSLGNLALETGDPDAADKYYVRADEIEKEDPQNG